MRDALLKHIPPTGSALDNTDVILPEDIDAYSIVRAGYPNLLEFERDFAQICDLIILFSESEGSLAELGAFAMDDEISRKLLLVLEAKYYRENSFIKLGPIKILEDLSPQSVFRVSKNELTEERNGEVVLCPAKIGAKLADAIAARLLEAREKTTLQSARNGHLVKLSVGLIQEFGALTLTEIRELLGAVIESPSDEYVQKLLFCAAQANWIQILYRGFSEYFVPMTNTDAATIILNDGSIPKEKLRRRAVIREHFEQTDPERFAIISEAMESIQ